MAYGTERARTFGIVSVVAATIGALVFSLPLWVRPPGYGSYPVFDAAYFVVVAPLLGISAVAAGVAAGHPAPRSTPAKVGLVLGSVVVLCGGLFLVLWLMQDAINESI